MARLSKRAVAEAKDITERLEDFLILQAPRINKNEQHDLRTGLDALKRISI